MMHFTLTGQHAGHVVCGAKRDGLQSYMHSPGTSQLKQHIERVGGVEGICPSCLAEFILTWVDGDEIGGLDIEQPLPANLPWDSSTPQWVKDLAQPTFDRIIKKKT